MIMFTTRARSALLSGIIARALTDVSQTWRVPSENEKKEKDRV